MAQKESEWQLTDALLAIARRFPVYVRLGWALVRDSRVPTPARRWLVGAGLYNLSPLDPVPGIIPVLGQLDDYAVLLLAIRKALTACSDAVRREHLERVALEPGQVDRDLREIRRIAGHVTRRAAWAAWAGLRFMAGVGAELGRQLLRGAADVLVPSSKTIDGPPQEEAAPRRRT
jgi:uncharacterized membrane protein YkvA (DUF1232 family)